MISAKDAYALAAPKLDEYRSFLDSRIREAAERGMTSVTVREDPYNNWLRNETTLDDMDARRCIRELRDLGYPPPISPLSKPSRQARRRKVCSTPRAPRTTSTSPC